MHRFLKLFDIQRRTVYEQIAFESEWRKDYDAMQKSMIYGNEVYIKIALGKPNSHTICISFHKAEHPMFYPLKDDAHGK